MSPVQPEEDTSSQLLSFIRTSFLGGDPDGELDEQTPLLEYGILNSLNTAELLAFVRDDLNVEIPFARVTAETFRSVATLAVLVDATRSAAG